MSRVRRQTQLPRDFSQLSLRREAELEASRDNNLKKTLEDRLYKKKITYPQTPDLQTFRNRIEDGMKVFSDVIPQIVNRSFGIPTPSDIGDLRIGLNQQAHNNRFKTRISRPFVDDDTIRRATTILTFETDHTIALDNLDNFVDQQFISEEYEQHEEMILEGIRKQVEFRIKYIEKRYRLDKKLNELRNLLGGFGTSINDYDPNFDVRKQSKLKLSELEINPSDYGANRKLIKNLIDWESIGIKNVNLKLNFIYTSQELSSHIHENYSQLFKGRLLVLKEYFLKKPSLYKDIYRISKKINQDHSVIIHPEYLLLLYLTKREKMRNEKNWYIMTHNYDHIPSYFKHGYNESILKEYKDIKHRYDYQNKALDYVNSSFLFVQYELALIEKNDKNFLYRVLKRKKIDNLAFISNIKDILDDMFYNINVHFKRFIIN